MLIHDAADALTARRQGQVQREGEVTHLICACLFDLTPLLASLGDRESDSSISSKAADPASVRLPGQRSRNFH